MRAADTSVLVAAFASWHPGHHAARRALGEDVAIPAHALVETYSVLTRLPAPHRVAPDLAAGWLRRRVRESVLHPDPATMAGLPSLAASNGVSGGAVYDALVGLTAANAGAELLTRDRRAVRTYPLFGVPFVLVGEGWALVVLDLGVDTSTATGRMVATVVAVVAEMERGLTGERVAAATQARRARGWRQAGEVTTGDPAAARMTELREQGLLLPRDRRRARRGGLRGAACHLRWPGRRRKPQARGLEPHDRGECAGAPGGCVTARRAGLPAPTPAQRGHRCGAARRVGPRSRGRSSSAEPRLPSLPRAQFGTSRGALVETLLAVERLRRQPHA